MTQLRKDEKQTPKMTEVQWRVQRKGIENHKGKISKEERNDLNAPVLKKVTKSTEKEHQTRTNISQDKIKKCDSETGHRKRPRTVTCFGTTAALGYHSNDLNMPPRSTMMGRRIYNSH